MPGNWVNLAGPPVPKDGDTYLSNMRAYVNSENVAVLEALNPGGSTGFVSHAGRHYVEDPLDLDQIPGTLDATKLTNLPAADIALASEIQLGSYVVPMFAVDPGTSDQVIIANGGGALAGVGFGAATTVFVGGTTPSFAQITNSQISAVAGIVPTKIGGASANRFIRDNGSTGEWSALTIPNAATAGDLPFANGPNALGMLPIGAANRLLTSSGSAPQWSDSLALGGTLAVTGTSAFTGTIGVGVAPSGPIGVDVRSTNLTGTTQTGTRSSPTWSTAATTKMVGLSVAGTSAAGTYTTVDVRVLEIGSVVRGANHTITTLEGVHVADLSAVSATNKRAIEATNSVRADYSSTADDTRFLLYDVTAGSLKRVSRGATDSGGTGFRVLRITN